MRYDTDYHIAISTYIKELFTEHKYSLSIILIDLWEIETILASRYNVLEAFGLHELDEEVHLNTIFTKTFIQMYFKNPRLVHDVFDDMSNVYEDTINMFTNELLANTYNPRIDNDLIVKYFNHWVTDMSMCVTPKIHIMIDENFVNIDSIKVFDIEEALYIQKWDYIYVYNEAFVDVVGNSQHTKIALSLYQRKDTI